MIKMAVGYLAEDWDPKLVLTKDKGKEFHCAVYSFGGGLVFWKRSAFVVFNSESDDYECLSPEECIEEYKKILAGEYDGYNSFADYSDGDERRIVMVFGKVMDEAVRELGLSEEEVEKIKVLYADCNRYWELESENDDDEDDYEDYEEDDEEYED